MNESPVAPTNPDPAVEPTEINVATRAELLPEELAVGSDDAAAQAEAILTESEERVADPAAGL